MEIVATCAKIGWLRRVEKDVLRSVNVDGLEELSKIGTCSETRSAMFGYRTTLELNISLHLVIFSLIVFTVHCRNPNHLRFTSKKIVLKNRCQG